MTQLLISRSSVSYFGDTMVNDYLKLSIINTILTYTNRTETHFKNYNLKRSTFVLYETLIQFII